MSQPSTSATGSPSPPTPVLGHVVVGFDGSPGAERAVDLAADEAVLRHSTLEVLHALEWVEVAGADDRFGRQLRENARTIVDRGAARARARHGDLSVLATVELANAIDALEAASDRAALLVVGSRGMGGFAGLLMGSVSLPAAAAARCPLLVVHPDHATAADRTPKSIVVGVSEDDCTPALEAAFAQAQARHLPLRAIHAWRYPAATMAGRVGFAPAVSVMDDRRAAARATLAAALEPLGEKYPYVTVTEDVVLDTPAHALITASADAELIVLTAHRDTGRFGPNLGRITHTVLHHAKSPTLLVPIHARPDQGRAGR
ncbi:universal stress protein [Embleya scabrispora]|uniref:universal stress protein n=1 Tax=Embleya scabrispora TaxID=159449 RepID=UPI00037A8705|nr:universal stress protein [Embleya scabrispora]MYS86291.1 universal stress protein [Streptomyces sp. SID5474]